MVAIVMYAGDVGVVTKASHSLGFTKDTGTTGFIQFLSFYQVDRDIAVKSRVMD
jgi:hypothetical protein